MDGSLIGVAERRLTSVLTDRLAEEPAMVMNGPRTVGKSTLLSALGERVGRAVIDCDDPATRSAVRNDPGRFRRLMRLADGIACATSVGEDVVRLGVAGLADGSLTPPMSDKPADW